MINCKGYFLFIIVKISVIKFKKSGEQDEIERDLLGTVTGDGSQDAAKGWNGKGKRKKQ